MVKIAINGFGRIGRLAFRRIAELKGKDKELEVVAINDLVDAKTLAYLLKYDTTHGVFDHEVSADDSNIIVDGRKIPVTAQKDPTLLKWSDFGAEVVLECTGRFKGKKDAVVHIEKGGAKAVIISAPADNETPTVVYGVNDNILTAKDTVVSGASCTTNCLAPVVKVLNDKFGIKYGFMTTVHAYTNDQTTLDLPKAGNNRRGRAAAGNIVPSSTGAAKAIGLVLPELEGKLNGGSLRVPVIDGSIVDLSLILKKKVDKKMINDAMKNASQRGALKGIL
jgi:glyceraldehyde 3-phosphate dehydrogenase